MGLKFKEEVKLLLKTEYMIGPPVYTMEPKSQVSMYLFEHGLTNKITRSQVMQTL